MFGNDASLGSIYFLSDLLDQGGNKAFSSLNFSSASRMFFFSVDTIVLVGRVERGGSPLAPRKRPGQNVTHWPPADFHNAIQPQSLGLTVNSDEQNFVEKKTYPCLQRRWLNRVRGK